MKFLVLAMMLVSQAASADCASITKRIEELAREGASAAEQAGESLRRDRRRSLEEVRSAMQRIEETLWEARRHCGNWGQSALGIAQSTTDRHEALIRIDQWAAVTKKRDPRYDTIEQSMLEFVDRLVLATPPQYWLPVIQLMYEALSKR